MKYLLATALAAICLLSSCSSKLETRFTPDGCLLVGTQDDRAGTVFVGFCDDGRWVAEWEVPQPRADKDAGPPSPPITFQVTRYKSGETAIKYKTAGGFVEWSEKSGITMGALPAGVLQ